MLSASFRRSGGALGATLGRRWPVLGLLACGAIGGATSHGGLRLNASRSALRGLGKRVEGGPAMSWILVVNPVRAMLRLAGLFILLALVLMLYRHEAAWPYALLGALGAVGLAVLAWILGTLVEVALLFGGLGILVARAVRGAARAGRALLRRACSSRSPSPPPRRSA